MASVAFHLNNQMHESGRVKLLPVQTAMVTVNSAGFYLCRRYGQSQALVFRQSR